MTALNILLQEYIRQSGYTIYSIANNSRINRTTLQKALSGERPLSRTNLDKLIPFLKLTPSELQTLEKAYTIASLGEITYQKHNYIKQIVEHVNSFPMKTPLFPATDAPQPLSLAEATVINGRYQIITTIKRLADSAIADSSSPFLHAVSRFHGVFFATLYQLLSTDYYANLEITHLIPFIKNTDSPGSSNLYNLEELSALLPFLFTSGNNCTFNYFYEVDNISLFASIPYDAYLLLNHNIVLLSADYENALVLPENCIAYFTDSFDGILKNSSPLLRKSQNPSILFFATDSLASSRVSHSIEMQPCVYYFVNEEIAYHVMEGGQIPAEQRKTMADLLLSRRDCLNQLENSYMLCSYSGFANFVENGIIYEVPRNMGRPLHNEERILILEQMIQKNTEGSHQFLLLKENEFDPQINLVTYDASSVIFYRKINENDFQFCSMFEPGLVNDINHFIENAINHDFSYNLEESSEIIANAIRKLKNK